jgi:hypothetical protein
MLMINLSNGSDRCWTTLTNDVFMSPFLSEDQCRSLLYAIKNQSGMSHNALDNPNNMHEYGVILHDPDLRSWIDELANTKLKKEIQKNFPDMPGHYFSSHHSFITSYSKEANQDLSLHVDASHITLNICLENQAQGADLVFTGTRCREHVDTLPDDPMTRLTFRAGDAVLHAGNQRHFVTALKSGVRTNLVIWMRLEGEGYDHSKHWVAKRCPVCLRAS